MANIEQRGLTNGCWFQAEEDKEVVGFAISSISDDGQLKLDNIHVNAGKRKGGIGSSLLNTVKGWGRSKGASKIKGKLGNEDLKAAKKFYANHGISVSEDGSFEGNL